MASTKKGSRIFLESRKLLSEGFSPSSKYSIEYNKQLKTITLSLSDFGDKKVSSRSRYNETLPIIDICNNTLTDVFDPESQVVARVKDGKIVISEQELLRNKKEREVSLLLKIKENLSLDEGSLCTGGGISTHAIHNALSGLGINSKVKMIAEIDSRYLQVALKNLKEVDVIHECKIEEIEFQDIPKLDILSFSLPCTGHSIAGKTARGLKNAEEHPEASTSVFGALRYIVKSNPALIISENVIQAQFSATYTLLKAEIQRLGYSIQEFILDETHAGALEKRKRYWFVAYSSGLPLDEIIPKKYERDFSRVGDIIDSSESSWIALDYFDKREKENTESGRGFKKNLIRDEDNGMGVIPRNYTKRQISNPHYVTEKGIRLFNLSEHSKIKGIPVELTQDLPATVGHEILGQSILYKHAYGLTVSVFNSLLKSLRSLYV